MMKMIIFSGHQEAGDALAQCQLAVAYEHKLKRNAFNFCYGTFGGIKGWIPEVVDADVFLNNSITFTECNV